MARYPTLPSYTGGRVSAFGRWKKKIPKERPFHLRLLLAGPAPSCNAFCCESSFYSIFPLQSGRLLVVPNIFRQKSLDKINVSLVSLNSSSILSRVRPPGAQSISSGTYDKYKEIDQTDFQTANMVPAISLVELMRKWHHDGQIVSAIGQPCNPMGHQWLAW